LEKKLLADLKTRQEKKVTVRERQPQTAQAATAVLERSAISTDAPVFAPADLKRHVVKHYDLAQVLPYINWQMLLGHHLGLKGKVNKLLAEKDERAVQLKETVDDLLELALKENLIKPAVIYQFFPAQADGNDLIIYDPADEKTEIERFTFPRQAKGQFLCLSDFAKPKEKEMDYVCFFSVTAGTGIREREAHEVVGRTAPHGSRRIQGHQRRVRTSRRRHPPADRAAGARSSADRRNGTRTRSRHR